MDYFHPATFADTANLHFPHLTKKLSFTHHVYFYFWRNALISWIQPTIASIIKFWVHGGSFPSIFVHVMVHLVLKKPPHDPGNASNCRPTLTFSASRILERVVINRMLTVYLSTRLSLFRSPLTIFRTACRKFHSTYPPLLLSVFIGKAKVTTLVLLNCCCYWYPGSFSSLALSQSMVLVFLPCLKFFCRLSQPPNQSVCLSFRLVLRWHAAFRKALHSSSLFTLNTTQLGALLDN